MSAAVERIRQGTVERKTGETEIELTLDLDGSGACSMKTGVLFLDHMLDALCRHSGFDLSGRCTGDATMDPHHTVEDVGIAFGQALKTAIGDRAGINRYGFAYAPLDEALARFVVDFSGRPFLEFVAIMPEPVIGADFASSLVEEFWRAAAVNGGLTIHIDLIRARNAHHAAEAIFKSAALALRQASRITRDQTFVPSTKGMLA
ncbi:MAG TPA: imidazoleglycerol-phosphate dehydratase HisB [Thermomicrobiales bacterium]|nr:imidazoleglycerol-phosphate dehydratase HisB [Thermomicrobiales bacterium]